MEDKPGQKRTETVRVRVTPQERDWLERVAREEQRSVSSVIRMVLRRFAEERSA